MMIPQKIIKLKNCILTYFYLHKNCYSSLERFIGVTIKFVKLQLNRLFSIKATLVGIQMLSK